jgi:hypothetical protein
MKRRTRGITLGLIVAAALGIPRESAQGQGSAWAAPIGIPAPPFGIAEQAGAPTATVAANGSIPTLTPGAVVQLTGTYSGSRRITCAGTQARPGFLRGPATLSGQVTVTGTFCVLERLQFLSSNPSEGPVTILSPSLSVVIRNCEISNPSLSRAAAGVGVGDWGAGGTNQDVVLYANNIHDVGNRNATTDQDGHGIGIGVAHHVWVLDNSLSRNSGDGIQINGGSLTAVHHVYVGRNTSFDNKQNGFWVKTAADVVFSQNVAHSHRPSGSSSGGGFGFQYDPARIWFLANESHHNTLGFVTGSANNGGRRDVYLLGNLLRDNLEAGVQLNGGVAGDFLLAHNTVANNPKGIENAYYAASPVISSNIITARTPYAFGAGGGTPTLRKNLTANPGFVPGSYRLAAGSAAIDTGLSESAAYSKFPPLYGPTITADRDGTARPQGAAWDVGAYEHQGSQPRRQR